MNLSRHGLLGSECLIFDRGEHPDRLVAAFAVVGDLEVLEDGVGQLDPSPPAFPVEDLDLEASPKRFDDSVVRAVVDRSHRWQ